jgi:hypothetical protein
MRRVLVTAGLALCAAVGVCAPALGARAWSTTTASSAGQEVLDGGFAVTKAGERVAVFSAQAGSATSALYGEVFSGSGSGQITALAGDYAYTPVIASGGGSTIAAWASSFGPSITYAIRPDGGAFGPAQTLAAGTEEVLRMNARGDAALLFTRFSGDTNQGQLFLAVRPVGSTSWTAPVAISDPVTSQVHFGADLALSPDGHIVAAWNEATSTGSVVKVAQRMIAGGAPLPAQTVSAAGGTALRPRLAVDGRNDAIVTWIDVGSDAYAGAISAAVAPAGLTFGSRFAIAGSTDTTVGAPVVVDDSGRALISWSQQDVAGQQATEGPARAVLIALPNGSPSAAVDLSQAPVSWFGSRPALDPDGNGIVYFIDKATREMRAVRHAAGATFFSAPETLVCPRSLARPFLGVGFVGANASLLWRQLNFNLPYRGLRLTADQPAAQAGPGPCPPRPAYTVTPASPRPGDVLTFDAGGGRDPEAVATAWSWDLDGDGSFEISDSSQSVERVRYTAEGTYYVNLRITNGDGQQIHDWESWALRITVGANGGSIGDANGPAPAPQQNDHVTVYANGGGTAGDNGYGSDYAMPPTTPLHSGPYRDSFDRGRPPPATVADALLAALRLRRGLTVGPVLTGSGTNIEFYAPRPGRVRFRWYLARKTIWTAAYNPDDGTVLGSGEGTATHAGPLEVRLAITRAGARLLRRARGGLRMIALGDFRDPAGHATSRSRTVDLKPDLDRCVNAPEGIRCQPGLGRRSPGGPGTGKVNHAGWPIIEGVMWILDDVGRGGTGTPDNDELLGGHGDDHLAGGAGNDVLWGDEWPWDNNSWQHDTLDGAEGDDWLYASHGHSVITAGPGDDTIWSTYGVFVRIDAGPGDDLVIVKRGGGTVDCGPGRDIAYVGHPGYRLRHCEVVRHANPSAVTTHTPDLRRGLSRH